MSAEVLVDTNLLVRLAQPTHPMHAIAQAAIGRLQQQGRVLCVVPQNLYEFWVVCTRPLPANGLSLSILEASAELDRITATFDVFPETPAFLAVWKQLVLDHQCIGKPAHDARLVAAMLVHGITHLLTFDAAGFGRYAMITVLTPAQVVQTAVPRAATAQRPDGRITRVPYGRSAHRRRFIALYRTCGYDLRDAPASLWQRA